MNLIELFHYWQFLRRLRLSKQCLLWETNLDKAFLEKNYQNELSSTNDENRSALEEENKKPEDKQDKLKIAEYEDKIALVKAVKMSYRKTLQQISEYEKYLADLKTVKLLK